MNISQLFPWNRWKRIREIISDLEMMKTDLGSPALREAVDINIEFFKAARNPITYLWWLISRAPKLRKRRVNILELADLLPEWYGATHQRLIKLERWFFPDLLGPIRKAIIQAIKLRSGNSPIVLLSLGAGAMELERQIIKNLQELASGIPVIFVGVDIAFNFHKIVIDNLASLGDSVKFQSLTDLTEQDLSELKAKARPGEFVVATTQTDIFNLENLPNGCFDIVYSSRFKHHLSALDRERFEDLEGRLGKDVLEFDDYCCVPVFIFPSILTWLWPETLNGAILSYLRDLSKKELQDSNGWKVSVSPLGYYLRTYSSLKSRVQEAPTVALEEVLK